MQMKRDNATIRKLFSQRLVQSRERAGLTVETAARKVGVKPIRWKRWEAGKALPSTVVLLLRAAVLLDVDGYWLYGMRGPKGKPPAKRKAS